MTQKLILIVEDEPDVARLLQFHLQRQGFRTATAADGRTALNETFARKPDLVLLDLLLPKLHGREVCRLVKSSPITRHIPVLMLTALAHVEEKVEGFKVGADDYLTKPFDLRELIARVKALLNRSQAPAKPLTIATDR